MLSFADATQCGDGTIYRAAGFVLTQITKNANLARLPSGEVIHKMGIECVATRKHDFLNGRSYLDVTGGSYNWRAFCSAIGAELVPGYQFRYIRFIDPAWRSRLTVPEIPFSDIPAEARMYRGAKIAV